MTVYNYPESVQWSKIESDFILGKYIHIYRIILHQIIAINFRSSSLHNFLFQKNVPIDVMAFFLLRL